MLLKSAFSGWTAWASSIALMSAFFLCDVRSRGGEPLFDGLLGTDRVWKIGGKPDFRDRRLYVRPKIFDSPAKTDGNQSGAPGSSTANSRVEPPGKAAYKIPFGGKMIGDIAREQLGSSLRWIDIYRMNPNLDVSQPIPEKTEILIPSR
jgi:hypothetical protein